MRSLLLVSLLLATVVAHAAVPPSPSQSELRQWMDEAFAYAAKVPVEQRRALVQDLVYAEGTREEKIKASLLAIALRPQFYGPFGVLRAAQAPRDPRSFSYNEEETAADRAAAEEFVVELYRARAGTANEEQLNWLSGLAELLFAAGRWKEALPLQRQLLEHGDRSTYAQVALALMEKVNGNDAPFAEIMAHCPPAPEGYGEPAEFCGDVTRSLIKRMTTLVPKSQHPPAVAEILSGRAVPTADMERRMHDVHNLIRNNPAEAAAALNAILAAADVPAWAKDDAVLMLMDVAAQDNWKELMMRTDCYLVRRGARVRSMTPAQWQELATVEPPSADDRFIRKDTNNCVQHHGEHREPIDANVECLAHVLELRHIAASNTGARDVLRQTDEWMAALVLESGRGMLNLARLMTMGSLDLKPEEARQQVLQYVARLPASDSWVAEHTEEAVRRQTKRVTEPWAASQPAPLHCTQ